MSEPMFSCSDEECANNISYPANMLRIYNDKIVCQECWDCMSIWPGDDSMLWTDLELFVPEADRRISELERQLAELRCLSIAVISARKGLGECYPHSNDYATWVRSDNEAHKDLAKALVDSDEQ